ncbi:sugar transferase [Nocardia panacis]|uniref:Sugar transferase n=1 Tax=Nocardia panacis TaxID=2340916 RepID=A0A3A4KKI9_9NOCA|nr:sugar transferase [Nocardia panacis]RJO73507.1 sugar transferase [Nocardia panacis]
MGFDFADHGLPRNARSRRDLPRSAREQWQSEYVRRVAATDFAVIAASVGLAEVIRFGGPGGAPLNWRTPYEVGYTVVSVLLALTWTAFLAAAGTRAPQVIGAGTEEYRRLVATTLRLFGLIAILALLLRIEFARGYLAIAFPLGLFGLMLSRHLWRRHARARRARGQYRSSVLVVGPLAAADAMAAAFSHDPAAGYHVVGVCIPNGPGAARPDFAAGGRPIAVIGDDRSVLQAVRASRADTVAVTVTDHLGPDELRRMAWDLDPLGVELIVAPGLIDVAGTRLTNRVVAGMPMLHLAEPRYDRAKSAAKTAFDLCFAAAALLAMVPTLVGVAILVKLSGPGPVFAGEERIGVGGKPFRMLRFRVVDAGGLTPIGRILRGRGLDELPQFLNVLRGEMSVVGPRPPIFGASEDRRTPLVKPGLTGLWQLSGRSDLSTEDIARLELTYVENWSMVLDLLLIAKTIGAFARRGY